MKVKKFFRSALALLLAFSLLPINVFAAVDFDINGSDKNDGYYSVISKQDWDIAPGISESEIVLNNADGTRRQVLHVMEADMNNEYTKVIGSYAEMNTSKYQTETMDKQAAWVEDNWELNVVGAMNTCLSWYSGYPADQVGKPLGFLMVDGEILWGECEGFPSVVVINKDKDDEGNARPSDIPKVEMVQIKSEADLDGWEEQVIPCSSGFIVKDGVNQNSANHSDAAPRSVVGIKADGTVVIMENDGRQAPFSTGMSMYELAEVMIGLGCTYAVNCDGGGSSTFLSQRPGEELEVNNSPSDGGLRPTTQGILFISTAPSDGTFVRASVEAEAQYYTPNSEVQFTAKGADFAGAAAEIPAEATWQLSDESFGSIDQNGLFVSNGKVGEVSAQIAYNGEVVGEFAINIVIPDAIQFSQSTLTVPNGQTTTFGVSAKYGNIEVVTKDADFEVVLDSENMGTLDGYKLTATEDASVLGGSITATLTHDKNITATMQVVYGKASEVVYDFENGFGDGWYVEHLQQRKNGNHAKNGINAYNNVLEHYPVTSETGMVHNGDGAAAVYSDTTRGTLNWLGTSLRWAGETVTYENVKTIGMWVYFPKDAVSTAIRFCFTGVKNGEEVGIDVIPINYGDSLYFEESGWKYCAVDVSEYDSIILKQNDAWDPKNPTAGTGSRIEISCQMNGGSSGEYDWTTTPGTRAENTFYVDDIIIDYSEACEDREEPIFGDVKYVEPVTSEDKTLNNQRKEATVTKYNSIGFNVSVADNDKKVNATGLDVSTAKAYIDGNEVKCSFNGSIMSVDSTELANGVHTVKFTICDKAGNYASVIRKIDVQAENNDSSIKVVVPEVENNMIFTGSQYWVDVVASEVENVDEVTVTLDLNNNNTWIPDHIETLNGFETTYTTDIAKENILYLTIKRTGEVEVTGEQSLVSVPVQTWTWNEEDYPGYLPSAGGDNDLNGNNMYDPYEIWQEYVTWNCDVIINPLAGNAQFVDGTEEWFSGDKIQVDTEQKVGTWWGASAANKVYFEGKSSWHLHVAGKVQSKEATCTEVGYTDRVFCTGCACVTEEKLGHSCDSAKGCGAVLDWGTTVPAKGHDWKEVEGKLTCKNGGELFNGIYINGKTYVDGVVISDGWFEVDGVKTYYYVDGVKLTGSHLIDGKMHTFDKNGVYQDGYLYDGFYEIDDTVMYFVGNEYVTGSQVISGEHYFFNDNGLAYDGEVIINEISCQFDNGVSVADENVLRAGICGEKAQFVLTTDGTITICGSGDMTEYNSVGNNPWYKYEFRSKIKKVVIGKDITSVGKRAFQNSPKLVDVVFEEGSQLKSLHVHSFSQCPKLAVLNLPEGLVEIQDSAFLQSPGLTEMYMPESITTIGGYAFGDTKPENLVMSVVEGTKAYRYAVYHNISYVLREAIKDETEEITIIGSGVCGENAEWTLFSDGKMVIYGSGAMNEFVYSKYGDDAAPWTMYRNDIKSIEIGKDIVSIGSYSFYNCTKLESVVFEEESKLESIGIGAFGYCGMKAITLPATLKTINKNAFYFSGLETVDFDEDSKLSTIGDTVLRDCAALIKVYVPESVTKIGEDMLYKTNDTVVVSVAEGTYSHEYALKHKYNIEVRPHIPVVLYSGTCGDSATWKLYDNGKMVIAGSGSMNDFIYNKYGENAAPWTGYRNDIKSLEIGKDITSIGTYSFYNCTKLESVVFEEGSELESIGVGAFGYCGMDAITLPAALKTIDKNAFYFSGLEKVDFEVDSELSTIGDTVFRNCIALSNIYIPESATKIGEDMLYKTNDTVVVSVAEGTYSHEYALKHKYNIEVRQHVPVVLYSGTCGDTAIWELFDNGKMVISGSGVMNDYVYNKYGDNAAPWTGYRSEIKSLEIGKDITAIGTYSFYNCTKLESVVFEKGSKLESIGVGAFGYCGMKEITLPAALKTIDKNAFYFSGLEIVGFEADSKLVTIGDTVLRNCTALTNVYIPDTVTKIGEDLLYKTNDTVVVSVAEGTYSYNYAEKHNYMITTR